MKTKIESNLEIIYQVGQKWFNTENGNEFHITEISENIVSLDDGKKKLSSYEHMNKSLWNHLVSIGFYKQIS